MSVAKDFQSAGYVFASLGSPINSDNAPSGTLDIMAAWTRNFFPLWPIRLNPLRKNRSGCSSFVM
eukprot:799403-Lingulodinium_polyedra.AAC.1